MGFYDFYAKIISDMIFVTWLTEKKMLIIKKNSLDFLSFLWCQNRHFIFSRVFFLIRAFHKRLPQFSAFVHPKLIPSCLAFSNFFHSIFPNKLLLWTKYFFLSSLSPNTTFVNSPLIFLYFLNVLSFSLLISFYLSLYKFPLLPSLAQPEASTKPNEAINYFSICRIINIEKLSLKAKLQQMPRKLQNVISTAL